MEQQSHLDQLSKMEEQTKWREGVWSEGVWSERVWSERVWNERVWNERVWREGVWKEGVWREGVWREGCGRRGCGGGGGKVGKMVYAQEEHQPLLYTHPPPHTHTQLIDPQLSLLVRWQRQRLWMMPSTDWMR